MSTYLNASSKVKYVLLGTTGYEITDTSISIPKPYDRLYFPSAAFWNESESSDKWNKLAPEQQHFFTDYPSTFDPQRQHRTDTDLPYGYSRSNAIVMSGYDAMEILLTGSQIALHKGIQNFTPEQLQQALKGIKGLYAYQGITGRISFDETNGDPTNKYSLILNLDTHRHHQVVDRQGCFSQTDNCSLEE
jgi:hypothetical protein